MESNSTMKNKNAGERSGSLKHKSAAARWGYALTVLTILLMTGGCSSRTIGPQTAAAPSESLEAAETAGMETAFESLQTEETQRQDATVEAEVSVPAQAENKDEPPVKDTGNAIAAESVEDGPADIQKTVPTDAAEDEMFPDRNDAEQEMLTQNKAEEKEASLKVAAELTEPAQEQGLYISQRTVEIPGLERTYRILYLTDTHIIYLNGEETEQELQNALPRAVDFRNSLGISSADQFPEWVRFANDKELDAVLLGGDIIDYPSVGNINYLNESLSELKVPWLYVPGNHDWTYPWEYMTEKSRNEYLVMLEELMGGNTAVHSLEFEDLIIAGTNNSSNQIESAALEGMEQVLNKAKPVVVMQHIPFATVPLIQDASALWSHPVALGHGIDGGVYPNETSLAYMQQLFGTNRRAALILAGHIHMEHEDILDGGILQLTGGPGYKGEAMLLTLTGTGEN